MLNRSDLHCMERTNLIYLTNYLNFQRKDFLQLMIDAAETGGEDPVSDGKENVTQKKKIPMTHEELMGQVSGMLLL